MIRIVGTDRLQLSWDLVLLSFFFFFLTSVIAFCRAVVGGFSLNDLRRIVLTTDVPNFSHFGGVRSAFSVIWLRPYAPHFVLKPDAQSSTVHDLRGFELYRNLHYRLSFQSFIAYLHVAGNGRLSHLSHKFELRFFQFELSDFFFVL